jgi:hypothetical protein
LQEQNAYLQFFFLIVKIKDYMKYFNGRSGGTRTPSPRFWRPVLYQLSYTP